MHRYLLPEDDGLPMRESGKWVAEKLYYLKSYINVFETAMRNKSWRKRQYIDLFAGPGKCQVKETNTVYLGSPLLALTTEHPFTDYYFVDENPEYINVLQKRCSVSPGPHDIQCFVGNSNVIANKIVAQINKVDDQYMAGRWSSLNLAFLDPDGLELEWKTVATLAQVKKMDLIIHYSQHGLNRNMPRLCNSEDETIIDRFFGDTEWRRIYRTWQKKRTGVGVHRQLMDYYKAKLQDLGYKEVKGSDEIWAEPLITNAKRNAPLYRLLFASKNELGNDFWEKVTRKDLYGQSRLF